MTSLHDLPLRHFSKSEAVTPYSQAQGGPHQRSAYAKPDGLWVSVEAGEETWGWSHWCASDWPGAMDNAFEHVVTLASDANLLLVEDAAALVGFHRQYGVDLGTYRARIGWTAVAADYQGIIITPYLWSMRLSGDVGWYYAWDCASGCIWDADAIESVSLVGAYTLPVSAG